MLKSEDDKGSASTFNLCREGWGGSRRRLVAERMFFGSNTMSDCNCTSRFSRSLVPGVTAGVLEFLLSSFLYGLSSSSMSGTTCKGPENARALLNWKIQNEKLISSNSSLLEWSVYCEINPQYFPSYSQMLQTIRVWTLYLCIQARAKGPHTLNGRKMKRAHKQWIPSLFTLVLRFCQVRAV